MPDHFIDIGRVAALPMAADLAGAGMLRCRRGRTTRAGRWWR
jgi:hypothetical protein